MLVSIVAMARNGSLRIAAIAAAVLAFVLFPVAVLAQGVEPPPPPPGPFPPIPTPTHTCSKAAPPQQALELTSSTVTVGYRSWGLVYLNSTIAFAAVNFSIAVLDTSEFTPTLVSLFPQPLDLDMGNDDITLEGYGFRSITLTTDKRNLYVATGYGAIIYDVPMLLAGSSNSSNNPIVGTLSHEDGYVGRSAIELSITPNDAYVFISQEFGSNATQDLGGIEVYNVARLANGTVISSWKGYILTGYRTIGQDFSQDYTKLFVTSEIKSNATSQNETTGTISVLDVPTLKVTPGKALFRKVTGGCHPVRTVMSADKNTLWVSLRDANMVMAFDASTLASNSPLDPVIATVNTGTSPIGMAAIQHHIFAADSNRYNYSDTTTGITVIKTGAALYEGQVNFPQIPTSAFPRELAVSPDGNTLLISEFGAQTIRAVNIASLNI
jgi:hypothetical protein